MANRKARKPSGEPDKAARTATVSRDPAELRAEIFRVAAWRETVEAFVVAFILALLFRAFLAEAFVIPTGSMAPTLMGAHKDLVCDQCATPFQVGASRERTGADMSLTVVAGICPNCRYVNSLDLAEDSNHQTFNGDRIVVSKYSYALRDPSRWDVIVFKYPGNPKQNYIKRLVGLPNEEVTIRHGNVFAKPTDSDEPSKILRKPESKLLAMRHLVYNTDHQAPLLIEAEYPSRWQPWEPGATQPPTDSWQIARNADGMVATIDAAAAQEPKWLRYYHRWPTDDQWLQAQRGESLASTNPYMSRLITDFYAYDSYVNVPARLVYEEPPSTRRSARRGRFNRLFGVFQGEYSGGVLRRSYQSGEHPEQFGEFAQWGGQDGGRQGLGRDGMHWASDLILEADLETSDDASEAVLELVKAGVQYRCYINLADGVATFKIEDFEARRFDDGASAATGWPTAQTSVRAGSRHHIRMSDCDDQLLLWIDGDLVEFDHTTTFNYADFRSVDEDFPQYLPDHPLDAAPAGIAVRGGTATVHSLRLDRDKYYIATKDSSQGIIDYDTRELRRIANVRNIPLSEIQEVFGMPDRWADFIGWQTRRSVTFTMGEDQYFPMGDNSPESLDARCWAGTKAQIPLPRGVNKDAWAWRNDAFVKRDLLVGKALVVFWPHSWNSPIPFTPNFKRMKFIH